MFSVLNPKIMAFIIIAFLVSNLFSSTIFYYKGYNASELKNKVAVLEETVKAKDADILRLQNSNKFANEKVSELETENNFLSKLKEEYERELEKDDTSTYSAKDAAIINGILRGK